MLRFLLIAGCLLAAIASYAMGAQSGIFLFIGLGMLFELLFWIKVLKRN